MTGRATCAIFACLFAAGLSPARAQDAWYFGHDWQWQAAHQAIYDLGNRIAYLQADPEIDDGYKGPIISAAHAEMLRLRAELPPAHWRWSVPCCYSRRPIHIR